MKKLEWHTEKRKVNDLIPYEGNPRQMTEKQKNDLEQSLTRFNLMSIPVINTDNMIISGHQRMKILQLLGRGKEGIDVRIPNRKLTEKELKEANLRENKNLGEWDFDILANFDEKMLLDVGFSREELDDVFSLDVDEEFDVNKELEKILEGKTRRVKDGDLWRLGGHKLIIGDCTNKSEWDKLFEKERFNFMFTDPPYNIAANRDNKKGFGRKSNRSYIGLTKKGFPEYDKWLSIANNFQNIKGASVMIFEDWKSTCSLWSAIEKYWKIKNMVIWFLPNRGHGYSRKRTFFNKYDIAILGDKKKASCNEEYEQELDEYIKEEGQKLLNNYEIIIYGQAGESNFERKKGSIWASVNDHITWVASSKKSTGQNIVFGTKPLQILVPYIKILSPRDGIIAEPFCGAGSTIIACEIMKRKCRAIEIEPIYGEVILIRWEKFTGKKAVKINGK